MILVTGATGQLGRVVIEHLTKQGNGVQIAGLARDEAKAADLKAKGVDIRLGDYNDVASLDAAMNGIEKVLLISCTEMDPARSLQQHANVIDAAKRAGVGLIAYTGRAMREPALSASLLMKGHFHTEDLIRESGLDYTFFRNALYLESIAYFIGKPGGTFDTDICLPTGPGKVAYTLRSELGEGIANALIRDDNGRRVYTLTAADAWSFHDVAKSLGDLSGQPVTFTPINEAAFEATMRERGVPEIRSRLISGFYRDIHDGQLDEVSPELQGLLGRQPTSLKAGLKALFNL